MLANYKVHVKRQRKNKTKMYSKSKRRIVLEREKSRCVKYLLQLFLINVTRKDEKENLISCCSAFQ